MTRQAAWNAERYHVVSTPHESWGASVLARIPAIDPTSILDAGCGTGKITRELLEQFPAATVYAVDYSDTMLAVVERELKPAYGDRVHVLQADLSTLTPDIIGTTVDLVFSTATFHWIKDHQVLFGRLYDLLNPGGSLVAQCGGGPNLSKSRKLVDELMASPQYASAFEGWIEPWIFADAGITAQRLVEVGFENVTTGLDYQPADMKDEDTFREFIRTVVYREHLAKLTSVADENAFVGELVHAAGLQATPWELDYWRLNMEAKKPD